MTDKEYKGRADRIRERLAKRRQDLKELESAYFAALAEFNAAHAKFDPVRTAYFAEMFRRGTNSDDGPRRGGKEMTQSKIVEEEEPVKPERKVGPNPYNCVLAGGADALEEAEKNLLIDLEEAMKDLIETTIDPRGMTTVDVTARTIKEKVSAIFCLQIDRLREAAEKWQLSCASSYHDMLKLDEKEWHENVEPIGLQETKDGPIELGNCRYCSSTLSRPKKKKDFEWAMKTVAEVREWLEDRKDLIPARMATHVLSLAEKDIASIIMK